MSSLGLVCVPPRLLSLVAARRQVPHSTRKDELGLDRLGGEFSRRGVPEELCVFSEECPASLRGGLRTEEVLSGLRFRRLRRTLGGRVIPDREARCLRSYWGNEPRPLYVLFSLNNKK